MQSPDLERFFDFTNRLVASSTFAGVRLGVLHTVGKNPTVIALRAELVTGADVSKPERFAVEQIAAFSAFGPIEHLPKLIEELDRWQLHGFVEPIHEKPIAILNKPWHYSDDSHQPEAGRGAYVRASGPSLREDLSLTDIRAIDRAIARQSQHQLASLSRLAAKFTGRVLDYNHSNELELRAPWPLYGLRTELMGTRLRVEIDGLPGSLRDRIVINLESDEGDSRVDEHAIQWTKSEGDQGLTYVGVVSDLNAPPTAVNVYYHGLGEIWLRDNPAASLHASDWERAVSVRKSRKVPSVSGQTVEAGTALASSSSGREPALARISKIHIEGFRSLRDIELELTPLTVLVGPNQAGKSSILDALDLLARGCRGQLYDAIVRRRGGLQRIAWRGDGPGTVQLDVDFAIGEGDFIRYQVVLGPVGLADYIVEAERILQRHNGIWHLRLDVQRGRVRAGDIEYLSSNSRELFIARAQELPGIPEIGLVRASLDAISIYPYLATGAGWANIEGKTMRSTSRPEPGARLNATGSNLTAALHSLREGKAEDWEQFLAIVKLAFPSLKDIRLPPAARGYVELAWHDERFEMSFDTSELSDGTLAYLANLCALLQPGNSLIALDEPERSLHPEALYRLIGAARMVSDRQPIIIATQSDRLIGFLDDIPESVVVVRPGPGGTELARPGKTDSEDLRQWLREFSLADLRHELETWGEE